MIAIGVSLFAHALLLAVRFAAPDAFRLEPADPGLDVILVNAKHARAPSKADDPAFRQWWAEYLRMGASPGAALALTKMNAEIDVRHVLPTVRVPTLVIHRTGDLCLKVEEGRYVASRIPGARFVELPGCDHLPFFEDQETMLDEIEEFLTGARHVRGTEWAVVRQVDRTEIDAVYAAELRKTLSKAQLDTFRTDLMKTAQKVAESSGGIFGVYFSVTGNERAVMNKIAEALTHKA